MTRRYEFKSSGGDIVIPVSDDQFFTDLMSVAPDEVDVYIAFYSDSAGETPATPTAGTATIHGEYLPGYFLEASTNAVIDATTVAPESTYTPPVVDGCTLRCRITLAGVTGASHFRAFAFKRS